MIHICVFVGLIIIWYIIIVVCISDKAAEVIVSFESNGNIEICHTSANDYGDVKIEILNANGETIYEDKVEKKEVLFAREDTYVSNEYVDAILVESELIHWKYIFCSEEIIKKSDQYCMCLTIGNGDKKIVLMNMFEKKDDKYLFAKKSISKKY